MVHTRPAQQRPPPCFRCHAPSVQGITRRSNRNGNVKRPFLRCTACTQFLGFIDDRGLDPHNPLCHCGVASRQQITGRNNKVPGAVHFVCAEGRCGFYSIGVDEEGRQVVVKEGMVEMLARLKII